MKKSVYWVLVILAIVVFSVFSVLIREEILDLPEWVIWVLGFVLIAVLGVLRAKKEE